MPDLKGVREVYFGKRYVLYLERMEGQEKKRVAFASFEVDGVREDGLLKIREGFADGLGLDRCFPFYVSRDYLFRDDGLLVEVPKT